jgi:hypothetical protein
VTRFTTLEEALSGQDSRWALRLGYTGLINGSRQPNILVYGQVVVIEAMADEEAARGEFPSVVDAQSSRYLSVARIRHSYFVPALFNAVDMIYLLGE